MADAFVHLSPATDGDVSGDPHEMLGPKLLIGFSLCSKLSTGVDVVKKCGNMFCKRFVSLHPASLPGKGMKNIIENSNKLTLSL